jgi:hypothetical protein
MDSVPHIHTRSIQVPDDPEDTPAPGQPLVSTLSTFQVVLTRMLFKGLLGPLQLPRIVFGGASFSYQYNSDDHLTSLLPFRSIRLALRCVLLLV